MHVDRPIDSYQCGVTDTRQESLSHLILATESSPMTALSETMQHDHARCDAIFADAEAAAAGGDWAVCQRGVAKFRQALLAHFAIEEDVIFPSFEAHTGMTEGPTRVMRGEHAQMRELVDVLMQAADEKDADAFADAAETLLILMQQHNMKEENILYPMCDQALRDDAQVCASLAEFGEGVGHV